MAKQNINDMDIPEIPKDEKILKSGAMQASSLFYKPYIRHAYKYALTEKGVWMRSPKVLFYKPKTSYLAYGDLESFAVGSYNSIPCCYFFPKKGKIGSRIFFDDFDGAVRLFDQFLTRSNPTHI